MVAEDYAYYNTHKDELVKTCLGDFLVIHNSTHKAFRSEKSAFEYGVKHYSLGGFSLVQCTEEDLVLPVRTKYMSILMD